MQKIMTQLLNLPGVIVEEGKPTEDTWIFFVKSDKNNAICPRCGRRSHRLHQNQRYLVKDLPIGNREVILSVNRRRFKCENCQKPFSETLDFVGKKKSFTSRYAQSVTEKGAIKLIDWLEKAEPYYKKSVETIKRWFAEIVGYFEQRTTSGVVEGINNRLKVLKRCGFGFRNFTHFQLRALLLWHFSEKLAQ
jgi:transposase